ncbi:MAG: hypothetical protein ABL964_10040 [Steroidobacteraceae bacterium]
MQLPYRWKTRAHQVPLWKYLAGGGTRAVEIAHRRWGKDDVSLAWTCCALHQRVGSYVHFLPEQEQARKAMWDMVDPHSGRRRIDVAFPKELRKSTNENEMMIEFLNGSTWQLAGSDNYNAMMGTSYCGMVFSEYALGNPSAWAYFSPILRENGGWAVFITTPRGHNHAEGLLKVAQQDPDWYWEVSTARDTDVFTEDELQAELRTLQGVHGETFGRAMWSQEYLCSFDAAIPGSIFGDTMDEMLTSGRIGLVPVDVRYPVHTGWDLGRSDDTVIWFYQVKEDAVPCFVDYHASNFKDIPFYADEVLEDMRKARGWKYGVHALPHDARPQTLAAGGKSMWQQFTDANKRLGGTLGKFTIAKRLDKQEQIQAARATLKVARIDKDRCADGVEALRAYQRVYDDEAKVFSLQPKHNWASHPADACMVVGISWKLLPAGKKVDDEDLPVVKATKFGQLKRRHLQQARAARNPY